MFLLLGALIPCTVDSKVMVSSMVFRNGMLLAKSDKKTKRHWGLEYTRPGKALFREGGPDVRKDHRINVKRPAGVQRSY